MISLRTTVTLIRLEESDQGTFGVLLIDGQVFCVTLEPKDEENRVNISSIPEQQYTCVRHISPKFGNTFILKDVPYRKWVMFHPGNWAGDTKGCIMLGERWDKVDGLRGVFSSKWVFDRFLEIMKDVKEFNLTVKEVY